jgi:hypothetical protein
MDQVSVDQRHLRLGGTPGLPAPGRPRPEQLQGHAAAELDVARLEDHAERAAPELALEEEAPYPLPRGERRRGGRVRGPRSAHAQT